ncbi:MAG: hypothetical protein IPM01_18090 [Burkholderiaceae bacterium]|nr:hypothetical protein [Burkholderiaceae bacterium]
MLNARPAKRAPSKIRINLAGGPDMASVDLGKVISQAVDDYKADFVVHLVATLLVAVIGGATFGLLSGPLIVGYMRLLDKKRRGEKIEIADIFKGFDSFLPGLLVYILGGLAVGIGFMLCFVPGLLLAPGWMAAFCLVARGESDAIAALKRGWSSSKPSLLMAAVTMLVISILMSIGAIACYVGIFLTLPFGFIAQYHLSRQLLDDAPAV